MRAAAVSTAKQEAPKDNDMDVDIDEQVRQQRSEEQLRELLAFNGRFYPAEAPLMLAIKEELSKVVEQRQSHWTEGERLRSITWKVRSAEQRLSKSESAFSSCAAKLSDLKAKHQKEIAALETELASKSRLRDDRTTELDTLKAEAAKLTSKLGPQVSLGPEASSLQAACATVEALDATIAELQRKRLEMSAPPPQVQVVTGDGEEAELQANGASTPLRGEIPTDYGKASSSQQPRYSPYPDGPPGEKITAVIPPLPGMEEAAASATPSPLGCSVEEAAAATA